MSDIEAHGLLRPSRFSVWHYKWRFYTGYLLYPVRRLWRQLRRDSYMLATLSSVNAEFMASMPGMSKEAAATFRPPVRQMAYPRLKGLRQTPIKGARDFLDNFEMARMLIVDITPSIFSGATMDPRIALLIGMAVAKNLPVYYIRAEDILPFQQRQIKCMHIPHKSMLVSNPDAIDFSNLAVLIEEC